jgi:uroporphyrinogen-III synthase
MNSALIEAILSYCELAKLEGVEYASIAFAPSGSDALFTCRAARRKHAKCIGEFAAEALAKAGFNCVMTLDEKDGVWWASVLPVPREAA